MPTNESKCDLEVRVPKAGGAEGDERGDEDVLRVHARDPVQEGEEDVSAVALVSIMRTNGPVTFGPPG